MKQGDRWLLLGLGIGLLAALMHLAGTATAPWQGAGSFSVDYGKNGVPREVRLDLLREQLRQGHLADPEAEFYEQVP